MCPNGHPYTVGECTRPMQVARCIACGAEIGGRSHVPAHKNTRVDASKAIQNVTSGYMNDIMPPASTFRSVGAENVFVSDLAMAVLRFVVHGVLLIALMVDDASLRQPAARFIRESRRSVTSIDTTEVLATIAERLSMDWLRLLSRTGLRATPLSMLLHQVLNRLAKPSDVHLGPFASGEERGTFEGWFDVACIHPVFGSDPQASSRRLISKLFADEHKATIRARLGEDLWHTMQEPVMKTPSVPPVEQSLWRMRTPVTMHAFQLKLASETIRQRCPVVATVLKEAETLPYIRLAPDILAWIAAVFEALGCGKLTRDEAELLSHGEVAKRIPNGAALFDRFCTAFNASLPLVEYLHECQRNPFLNADGKVDLGGTGKSATPLCESTPIFFSLPNGGAGSDGTVDARGLCTIRLLQTLIECHNRILQSVDVAFSRRSVELEITEDDEDKLLAPVSQWTPPRVLRRQLLDFDTERDVLPIVIGAAKQSQHLGEGMDLDFHWNQIEAQFADRLLIGKRPVQLQLRHFQFRGELMRVGGLGALRSHIPQSDLAGPVAASLAAAFEDPSSAARTLARLRDVAAFVTATAAQLRTTERIQFAARPLCQHVADTLMIPRTEWEQLLPGAASDDVTLGHLASLIVTVETATLGSVVQRAHPSYQEPIAEADVEAMTTALPHLELDSLRVILREFITSQLQEAHWEPDACLKQYLEFSTDEDLGGDGGWFDVYFPETLQLRHATATYRVLSPLG